MYSSNETKPYHGRLWRGTVAAIFTCVCLCASMSRAQEATEPTPEDMARSAALFEEAEVAYNAAPRAGLRGRQQQQQHFFGCELTCSVR